MYYPQFDVNVPCLHILRYVIRESDTWPLAFVAGMNQASLNGIPTLC